MNPFASFKSFLRSRKAEREEWVLQELKARYHAFRIFLENNGRALELIVSIDSLISQGDGRELHDQAAELGMVTGELVDGLNLMSADAYPGLYELHGRMVEAVNAELDALVKAETGLALCIALDGLEPGSHRHAGSKAANLATLRAMGLPVPDGFVCTVGACRKMVRTDGLEQEVRQVLRDLEVARIDMTQAAERIQERILATPLPQDLADQMAAAYERLTSGLDNPAISVRSSGVSEDRPDHSFAGQFTSILNVTTKDELFQAYREVVASGFSARALAYRQHAGLDLADFNLAVLCQCMVKARAAGVLMTRDPGLPRSGRMLISAVPGLGTLAVGGSAPADLYRPWRTDAAAQDSTNPADDALIPRKTVREVADAKGGLRQEAVPESEQDQPLLGSEIVAQLARYGEMIESLEGMPQDIEWAVDEHDALYLLQARPLRVSAEGGRVLIHTTAPLASGVCACAGKAVGQVLLVHSGPELAAACDDLDDEQAARSVLVLPQAIMDAARYLPRLGGLIVDAGNPTDHLSCIAREYAVPMITGTVHAAADLRPGQWIVLDADNGHVLEASADMWTEAMQRRVGGGRNDVASGKRVLDPVRERLHRLVVPLNLTDAYGPTFSVSQCRSLHDVVRYTHEMAVLSMFHAGDFAMEEAGGLLCRLDIGVPFAFVVIDVGGGLNRIRGKRNVLRRMSTSPVLGLEDVLSRPLAALCEGLITPGLSWHPGANAAALNGLISRNMLDAGSARPAGSFNYALAARDYLNLNSRVEFHFAMLDAVCGGDAQANYIRFRFKGGGTGAAQSSRRAVFLREVLEANGFYTAMKGDLVTASLSGVAREIVRERLVMLGRLIGFSRCLDAVMHTEETAHLLARGFLDGCYDSGVILARAGMTGE